MNGLSPRDDADEFRRKFSEGMRRLLEPCFFLQSCSQRGRIFRNFFGLLGKFLGLFFGPFFNLFTHDTLLQSERHQQHRHGKDR